MPSTIAAPPAASNSPARDLLVREVRYRLSYRGTLELDVLCRAALPHIESLDEQDLLALRDFLLHTEGQLMAWLIDGKPCPPEVSAQVAQLRQWFAAR